MTKLFGLLSVAVLSLAFSGTAMAGGSCGTGGCGDKKPAADAAKCVCPKDAACQGKCEKCECPAGKKPADAQPKPEAK